MFWAANGPMPTTTQYGTQATGTALRTMLQVATPSTSTLKVVAFGIEFATALTAVATVDLVDTSTVACTAITAHVAAGVQPYGADAQGGTSVMTLGTGATGYSAGSSTEGTPTSVRVAKTKIMPVGATSYEWEWSLGREFIVPVSHFLRLRVNTTPTINVFCWALWDE